MKKVLEKWMKGSMVVLAAWALVACSDDETPGGGSGIGDENDTTQVADMSHFDVWVSVGKTSGMGSTAPLIVRSLNGVNQPERIDFEGQGVNVTERLYQESIIKGTYYYQVPKSEDRFGKYQITESEVKVIKETNLTDFKGRNYTHCWTDDRTLVLLAADGDAKKVIWAKLDAEDMRVLNRGVLNIPEPGADSLLTTSGLAGYRASDGKILYSYYKKKGKRGKGTRFNVAFIDAGTMNVEKIVTETRAQQMAGSAYGELLQDKTFFDDDENYYIACNSEVEGATSSTEQYGRLLRVKKGSLVMDPVYEGYKYNQGKLVTVEYLGYNKALLYIQDPMKTGAAGWGDDFNCYYAVLNLENDQLSEIQYEERPLPYSSGTFSQRSTVVNGKAYIGVNPEAGDPCVYVYDIQSGEVQKGISIADGYEFSRLVYLADK